MFRIFGPGLTAEASKTSQRRGSDAVNAVAEIPASTMFETGSFGVILVGLSVAFLE